MYREVAVHAKAPAARRVTLPIPACAGTG